MKRFFSNILIICTSFLALLGLQKKKEKAGMEDAIVFPGANQSSVVEDFEIAAYHNQA
ncbi:MAG: hypothetical protein ACK43J_07125 [Chitinophagaceae bacterium]|jgi:hypothetical protein